MTREVLRADRQALLELDALMGLIEQLRDVGGRDRFDRDDVHRWALHRLWIAAGNEAAFYAEARGRNVNQLKPWGALYRFRNRLAHLHLPDIDEDDVWRRTVMRPAGYRAKAREQLT